VTGRNPVKKADSQRVASRGAAWSLRREVRERARAESGCDGSFASERAWDVTPTLAGREPVKPSRSTGT
jgi:hypothetical protein